MTDNATIRAWAADVGLACPARGKIPSSIREQYAAVHGQPDPAPEVEAPAQEEPQFTVAVDLYGHAFSQVASEQLVEALYSTWLAGYEAGKVATRSELLAALTGDGA